MAEYLDWPHEGLQRLREFNVWQEQLRAQVSSESSPSEVARWGDRISVAGIILVAAEEPSGMRALLWQYLAQWRQLKAPINGHDLKTLGYTPGPNFKRLLQALRDATLDDQLKSRDEAIAFLQRTFPSAMTFPH